MIRWDWVVRNADDILVRVWEHLLLTGLAVGIGLIISMVLAGLALRYRKSFAPIVGATGVLYTIPSLAAFAILVPFFGFSLVTAEVALISYTLLILVRNIVAGIDGVPRDVKEAARGMGYRPARLFFEIELPLALPVIVAGIRIATVTVVGLVTVTAMLGMGGVGFFILNGYRKSIPFATEIIVGVVLAVIVATVLDLFLLGLERLCTPWARRAAA